MKQIQWFYDLDTTAEFEEVLIHVVPHKWTLNHIFSGTALTDVFIHSLM